MLIIKKANSEDRKIGWSFDYQQIQKIQDEIEKYSNERLSMEKINAMLSYLETNFAIKAVEGGEK